MGKPLTSLGFSLCICEIRRQMSFKVASSSSSLWPRNLSDHQAILGYLQGQADCWVPCGWTFVQELPLREALGSHVPSGPEGSWPSRGRQRFLCSRWCKKALSSNQLVILLKVQVTSLENLNVLRISCCRVQLPTGVFLIPTHEVIGQACSCVHTTHKILLHVIPN